VLWVPTTHPSAPEIPVILMKQRNSPIIIWFRLNICFVSDEFPVFRRWNTILSHDYHNNHSNSNTIALPVIIFNCHHFPSGCDPKIIWLGLYIYVYIYIIHDSRHILINGWFNPTKKSTFFAGEIPTLTETTTYRKPRAVHAPAYWEHISSLGADFFKLTRNDLTAEGARNCGSVDINGHL
jgi:hypothetical protein